MLDFLKENAGTLVVALVLLIGVIAATAKIIRDKKNGKSCGCGECTGCPNTGACGAKGKEKE